MRKNILYADRVKGDFDLGLEPSRIWPDAAKAWARMNTPGGLIPGGVEQDIYEISTTQNFRIGTRRVQDERVFRYAYTGLATLTGRAVQNLSTNEERNLAAAGSLAGATTVTITVIAAAGLAENELQGGYVCWTNITYQQHRIASHPQANNGATCVLTLETPVVTNPVVLNTTRLFPYHSPYASVGECVGGANPFAKFVGMPPGTIAADKYIWIQTWGPVNVCPVGFYGGAGNQNAAWFAQDGALSTPAIFPGSYQRAGYWLPCTYYGGAPVAMEDGNHLLMLQISP